MSGREGARAHFVALRAYGARPVLEGENAALFCRVLSEFRERFGFRLHAYVVLPARAGLVLSVRERDGDAVRILAARLATRHARELHAASGWPGRIFHDDIPVAGVETAAAIARRAAALHRLPVQAGLARRPTAWPWSSARAWTGHGQPPAPVDLPEEALARPPGGISG